jgi:hypothetical protein
LFDTTLHLASSRNFQISHAHIRNFGLDSNFTISGDTAMAMIADYTAPGGDTLNVFRYVFVKDLGHKYPNGDNHWMEAAVRQWAWFRKYRKP